MSPAKKVPIIVQTVSDYFNVTPDIVRSKNPVDANALEAQFVAMYLIRYHTTYTHRHIYELFGYSYEKKGIQKIADRLQHEKKLQLTIDALENQLQTKYKE